MGPVPRLMNREATTICWSPYNRTTTVRVVDRRSDGAAPKTAVPMTIGHRRPARAVAAPLIAGPMSEFLAIVALPIADRKLGAVLISRGRDSACQTVLQAARAAALAVAAHVAASVPAVAVLARDLVAVDSVEVDPVEVDLVVVAPAQAPSTLALRDWKRSSTKCCMKCAPCAATGRRWR